MRVSVALAYLLPVGSGALLRQMIFPFGHRSTVSICTPGRHHGSSTSCCPYARNPSTPQQINLLRLSIRERAIFAFFFSL